MVESTIRAVDTNVSFRRVHAKKGKFVRAEPISALFEQNRVKIAGSFPALEDQLCSYDGSGDSPDRLDSMVYALIDLMVAARVPQFLFAAVDPAKISLILRAKYEFPLLIHPHYFAD